MWLGDKPSHIEALEIAVRTSPGSIVARYLLGRTYRIHGKPEKTIVVLEPVIKEHPDEYRSFIEYGLAMLDLGKPASTAAAVLNVSNTYGLSDARFVATLGGMLFVAEDHKGADAVFKESVRREFPYPEAVTIHFRPKDKNGAAMQIRGKVTRIRPNFALIQSEGYPTFVCPRSKFGTAQLSLGADVQFTLEFSAKGPVAVQPVLVQ